MHQIINNYYLLESDTNIKKSEADNQGNEMAIKGTLILFVDVQLNITANRKCHKQKGTYC